MQLHYILQSIKGLDSNNAATLRICSCIMHFNILGDLTRRTQLHYPLQCIRGLDSRDNKAAALRFNVLVDSGSMQRTGTQARLDALAGSGLTSTQRAWPRRTRLELDADHRWTGRRRLERRRCISRLRLELDVGRSLYSDAPEPPELH